MSNPLPLLFTLVYKETGLPYVFSQAEDNKTLDSIYTADRSHLEDIIKEDDVAEDVEVAFVEIKRIP